MGISDELKQKIGEVVAQEKVATRDDFLDDNFLGFTLSPDYSAYSNVRTTLAVDGLTEGELTHLKFRPMVDNGLVVGEAAKKGEIGAEEFSRTESRRSGSVPLRAALRGFDLEWQENRNLLLPVTVEEVPLPDRTTKKILVIHVKRPATKERVSRPRKADTKKNPTSGAPGANSAAGAQSGGQVGTQPETKVREGETKA